MSQTIIEKAKRYDEIIEEVKGLLESIREDKREILEEDITSIFTELQESESEMIRKWLIGYFNQYIIDGMPQVFSNGLNVKEVISWLEKQGDKDELIKELGKYKAKYTQEVLEKHLRVMNKDDERLRKTTISFLKDFADKGYENAVECIDWLEKQSEQKSQGKSALEAINEEKVDNANKVEPKFKVKYAGSEYNVLEVKDIAGVAFYGIEDEPNHIDYVQAENCERVDGYSIKESGSPFPTKPAKFSEQNSTWSEEDEAMLDDIIDFLEKGTVKLQHDLSLYASWLKSLKYRYTWKPSGEQKQEEKPRYNIGDVICDKSCTTLNKEAQPNMEIVDIKNGMYICDKGSFPVSQQDEYVLVGKKIDMKPVDSVSNELRTASFANAKKEILNHTFHNNEEFELAYTFEEGAKWDAAQKHNWSDEDEEELKIALNTLEEAGQYSSAKWLKNVCLVPQTIQKPTEWSEEDEEIIRTIISDGIRGAEFDMLQIGWLKSLKERYTWKPSDEQMDALDGICSYIRNKADWEISQDMVSDLYKLSEQLKKLKGE